MMLFPFGVPGTFRYLPVERQLCDRWSDGTRYDYAGTYKLPNSVPIDKWMMRNATRVMLYRGIMDMFPDNSKWIFLDEKHVINKNVLPKKIRADPLAGYVDTVVVSGNFCDAHICCDFRQSGKAG
jgi:hypothetical protein